MDLYTVINLWISEAIFWIGILIVITGLLFILMPARIDNLASRANKWISTSQFFQDLDRFRDNDRFFYRYHKITGAAIVLCTVYIFHILLVNPGYAAMTGLLESMADSAFSNWLYPQLLIILMLVSFIALFIGVIIFTRPTALKNFDAWVSRWIETQEKLQVFDATHSLAEEKVKKNLRVYGIIVFLGGCYITLTIYLAQLS